MQKIRSLCVFLPSGKTFTFKNVKILCDNENLLELEFKSMSAGNVKRLKFQKAQIVGYSA